MVPGVLAGWNRHVPWKSRPSPSLILTNNRQLQGAGPKNATCYDLGVQGSTTLRNQAALRSRVLLIDDKSLTAPEGEGGSWPTCNPYSTMSSTARAPIAMARQRDESLPSATTVTHRCTDGAFSFLQSPN
jgi:hypothetical protein